MKNVKRNGIDAGHYNDIGILNEMIVIEPIIDFIILLKWLCFCHGFGIGCVYPQVHNHCNDYVNAIFYGQGFAIIV